VTISHVKLTFKIKDVKSLSIALSRIKHDNVKITRKGGAGLQHDNNLAGKIQREWTLGDLIIETNLVGWHSRIIGTPSHLSKSCLLIRFLG
jgi:hypothetical protein